MAKSVPDVALNVDIDYTEPLTRKLEDGLLDLVLVFGPRTGPGLVIEPLIEDELVLVATEPRAVASGWVADYVFVERGFEFFAAHAEAFPDADTPARNAAAAAPAGAPMQIQKELLRVVNITVPRACNRVCVIRPKK